MDNQLKFYFLENGQLVKKIGFAGNERSMVTIGKSDCDIIFKSNEVSRIHAQLLYDGKKVYIQDCTSTNGTFINGKKIQSGELIELKLNDNISFSLSNKAKLNVGFFQGSEVSQSFENQQPYESLIKYLQTKQEIIIGRSPDCDVVLDHPSVSRTHARVSKSSSGKFQITDLNSLNGTFVNNKRVHSATLTSKDKIFIGRFQFSLEGTVRNLSQESAVRASNICKQYKNGHLALKETTFDIPAGGLIAIMGPSGCGKSTLLKVLNGDSPASSGQVYIHGLELISNYGYLKTQIGYVPQDDIVHRELTVEQSLFYSAKIRLEGVDDNYINEKIETLLNELKISEIRNNLVSNISGGQRKRVSIAVELLSDPAVLFLDEPTSPLDPQTIEEFMSILRYLSEKGTTVILVTHKPDDLNHMDSVMFMAEGGFMIYFGSATEYKAYFSVKSPVEVYANISGEKAKYWINKSQPNNTSLKTSQGSLSKIDNQTNSMNQLYWLFSRYLKIKTNDITNSAIMILQAPIIAILICFIYDEIRASVPFLMAISAIWFGVNNAAREIVSEAAIYKRERMFNVLIFPYILSKLTVLGIFAIIQSTLFNVIIAIFYSKSHYTGWIDPIAGTFWMFFITIVGSIFGLLISSLANTSEKVMSIVPIAVIPQIMLAGIITKIPNAFIELISYLTFSRWGTEGFDHIQKSVVEPTPTLIMSNNPGIPPSISQEDSILNAYKILNQNFDSSYHSNFGSLEGTLQLDIFAVSTLGIFCLIGIWISLKNKDSI